MFSLGVSLYIGYFLTIAQTLVVLVSSLIGSLIPDADLRYRHRTALHNIFSLVAIPLATGYILYLLGASLEIVRLVVSGLSIGYLTHIIGDIVTYRGVALLYPLSRKRYSLGIGSTEDLHVNMIGYLVGLSSLILYIYTKTGPRSP